MKKKIILLLVLVFALALNGCGDQTKQKDNSKPQVETQAPKPADKTKVTLYFANEKADALVPEVREIDKPNDLIVALIDELKKPGKKAPILPEGTELVFYQKQGNGTLVLNFNKAFANLQGTTEENMTINAVVDTITEQTPYKKIMFTVERQPLATGHEVYNKPLERNESIIKK